MRFGSLTFTPFPLKSPEWGGLQEQRFFEEEGKEEGKVNLQPESQSEPLSAFFESLNPEDRPWMSMISFTGAGNHDRRPT